MRLTFIHDHKFYYENGQYYSSGKFTTEIMSRYLIGPIKQIQIIARVKTKLRTKENLSKASSEFINIKPLSFLKRKSDFILKKRKIMAFLKKNISKNDIVIVRLPSEIGYLAIKYLTKNNIPYGIELVGDPWDSLWYHGSIFGKVMAIINKVKVKKIMSESKNNIYVTKDYLQKKYPSKNYFVASNVLINKVENNYQNKKNKTKKIGMIGSLDSKYKGIETALKSLNLVNEDFVFEIVGNGPQKYWKKEIHKYSLKDKVKLLGTLKSGDEINNWLSSLDLYIQPSYTEGLPRALVEAMSNGIPSLGSTAGGIPELLNENYQHKIKDYKTLAKQISRVLNDEAYRNEMSKSSLVTAKKYLSNDIEIERKKFIKSILKEFEK